MAAALAGGPDVILPPDSLPQSPANVADVLGRYGKGQAQGMADLLMGPGRAAQGQMSPDEMKDWGPQMALAMAGKGAAPTEGAAGIFGGRLAKGADLNKMVLAQMQRINERDPGRIWNDTNWARGLDRNWRFEIPDSQATLQVSNDPTLGNLLRHHALYKNYPDLTNMPVKVLDPGEGYSAYYQPPHPEIEEHIGISPSHYGLPAFLHEIQHAIQTREGFTGGANREMTHPIAQKEEVAKGLYDKLPPGDVARWLANRKDQLYNSAAGEVEARNVERRFQDPWLMQLPPQNTEDLLPYQQVLFPRHK
jgi:hypothetical protein